MHPSNLVAMTLIYALKENLEIRLQVIAAFVADTSLLSNLLWKKSLKIIVVFVF